MGLGDALNKAKDAAAQNPDAVSKGIDAAAEQVKSRVGGENAGKVDQAVDAAKDQLGIDKDGQA